MDKNAYSVYSERCRTGILFLYKNEVRSMRMCYIAVLAGLLLSNPALADVPTTAMGQCPFTSFAGTSGPRVGTNTFGYVENAGGRGGAAWFDWSTSGDKNSSPYLARNDSNLMYYQESWTSARDFGTLMIATAGHEQRSASGKIYVQRSEGGQFELWGAFAEDFGSIGFYDVNEKDIWGVRIEVTGGSDPGYFQMGSVGFFEERFTNVAFGKTSFWSDDAQTKGNMTDQRIYGSGDDTRFRSSIGDPDEEWVGVDLGQAKLLRGLLIDTCPNMGNGDGYAWRTFDVQVFRNNEWVTLGRADAVNGNDLYWVDFGDEGEWAEKVRLYGGKTWDEEGNLIDDNTPVPYDAGHGRIITEIMAFEIIPAVPEPATMGLLVLGGLSLLRRRT